LPTDEEVPVSEQRISPNIWCHATAEQAGACYVAAFQAAGVDASWWVESHYPTQGLPAFQQALAGQTLTVAVLIGGFRITLINADDHFRPTPAISFLLNFDPLAYGGDAEAARAALDVLWGRLGDGGEALMPLGQYAHSAHYGWVQDRFGVGWQLMLTDPAGDPRPFVSLNLLFGDQAQNRAGEAVDCYLGLFDDAALGTRVTYPQATGPAAAGAVLFADFRIGQQWLSAMDAASPVGFTFGAGLSLQVDCADQAEIDRLWDALSAVPAAEQCGWLQDRFGVSWQIVPRDMADLMARPNAYHHMLGMKKLVIADF
jgi:predicted 3-demethylubiquinone-9 3-methyltransferase (glyoxalase superfamily)